MNDDLLPEAARSEPPPSVRQDHTIGSSTIFRLCEEVIALREMNNRQHKMFEQALQKTREKLQENFNSFAADTQRAYQQLRQEVHGEKRVSLTLLNELLELGFDMERLTASWLAHVLAVKPSPEDTEAVAAWMGAVEGWGEAVQVELRRVQDALRRHGIHPYDAVIGSPYDPKLHERVGGKRVEGMGPLLVAEQTEHGYASAQPEFVLRRPKVIVSE
jgi:hypothetical protein